VENLYRYEHPSGYQSCYTIVPIPEHGGCSAILDILTMKSTTDCSATRETDYFSSTSVPMNLRSLSPSPR